MGGCPVPGDIDAAGLELSMSVLRQISASGWILDSNADRRRTNSEL